MRDRFFNFLSWITTKHPWKIIIASFIVFAAAVGFASTIKPKLSWLDLLPPDAPSVIEFDKILKLYGSSDTIVVSIEGDDPDDLAAFAEKFTEKTLMLADAEGNKLVKYVNYGEDLDFIRNHGLMLVKEKDLERMRGSGMFDAPGILHAVDTSNRDFKKEYVEEGGESLQKKENDAARAIDTMWHLPKTLRWFLENSDRPDDELRPVVEQGAEKYLVGEHRQFSDDRSILIIMVQPAHPSTDTDHAIATAQRLRTVFEEVMEGHPAIAKNYPGPWPETPEWKYFYEKVKDDPAKVDKLRMQIGKDQPHIAPEDRKQGATGMTGMHIYGNDEYSTMMHDMKGTNMLSFLAVFVLFVLAFRMWTSPLLAMGVLVFAITVGVALVAIVLGELNMMSMMFPVILIGLGIDYSIHIISGFTQLRRQGKSIEEAMRQTFLKTGRGILTGALTTSMAFLALGISSFKGFSHLGISSGIGVLCTLAASFFILPPFLVVLHRWKDRRKARKEAKKKEPAGEDGLKEKKAFMLEFKALTTTGLLAYRGWVVVILVVVAISIFFSLRVEKVKMAKNMLDIEARNLASVELNRVLSKRFFLNSDGSFVTADSLEQSDELHRKMEELGTVRLVSSISLYVPPPEKQKKRGSIITDIRDSIDMWDEPENFDADSTSNYVKALKQMDCNVITMKKMAFIGGMDRLFGMADMLVPEGSVCVARQEGKPRPAGGWPRIAASDDVKAIEKMLDKAGDGAAGLLDRFQAMFEPKRRATLLAMANPGPVGIDDLPESVRNRYLSNDGKHFILTVYPRQNIWEEDFQKRFISQVKGVSERSTGIASLFVETVERGAREGVRATIIAIFAILLLLLLDFSGLRFGWRSMKKALLATFLGFVPLAVSALWMIGSMNLLGIDLDMVNIMAVPLLLGIGIDDAVHIIHRYRIEGGKNIRNVYSTTGRAILITSLTTIAAFGSFMLCLYRGFVSMGLVLTIGIAICFLLSVYFLPALIKLAEKLKLEL